MKKILIIDIETTGFSSSKDVILEVGATEIDFQKKEFKIVFDQAIMHDSKYDQQIKSSWIAENSNILENYFERARPKKEVFDELQELLNQYPDGATAFNNQFDFRFLITEGMIFPKKLACLMILSTNLCKFPHAVAGRKGYKWPKVEEAFKHLFPDSDYVEQHRGADDSYHEAKIAFKLHELGILK